MRRNSNLKVGSRAVAMHEPERPVEPTLDDRTEDAPSRLTPARIRGRRASRSAAVAPPLEWPNAPTRPVEPADAAQRREPSTKRRSRERSANGRGRRIGRPGPQRHAVAGVEGGRLGGHVDADDDGAVAGQLGRVCAHERGRRAQPGDISSTGWLPRAAGAAGGGGRGRARRTRCASSPRALCPGRLLGRGAQRRRRWRRGRRPDTRCGAQAGGARGRPRRAPSGRCR